MKNPLRWAISEIGIIVGILLVVMAFCNAPAPVAAKDKSDRDRIAALETENVKLRADLERMDTASQSSFEKAADLLSKLARWNADLEERVTAIESMKKPRAKLSNLDKESK